MPSSEATLDEFLTYRRIAVVGVTPDRQRFGNRIYFNLKSKGYEVYAVHPAFDQVEGDPCYPNLSALPTSVDVVNMVVHPKRGKKVVEECLRLGLKRIWFQPGAESEDLIAFCHDHGMRVVHGQCLMVLAKPR